MCVCVCVWGGGGSVCLSVCLSVCCVCLSVCVKRTDTSIIFDIPIRKITFVY